MRIDRTNVGAVSGPQRSAAAAEAQKPRKAEAQPTVVADKVTLSAKAKEAAVLKARLAESPEVRAELVQKLKQEIETGNYKVDAKQVAESLMRSKVLG